MRPRRGARWAAIGGALALCACDAGAPAQAEDGRVGPSGYPVPRYVSLKFDKVNARAGPSDSHRLLWVYRSKGLPVQVVAETTEWRRICDPDGSIAWVHRRTTDGRRTLLRQQATPVALHSDPNSSSAVTARMAGRSVAQLVRCEGGWCKVRASGRSGWAPTREFWGTSERVQCR